MDLLSESDDGSRCNNNREITPDKLQKRFEDLEKMLQYRRLLNSVRIRNQTFATSSDPRTPHAPFFVFMYDLGGQTAYRLTLTLSEWEKRQQKLADVA